MRRSTHRAGLAGLASSVVILLCCGGSARPGPSDAGAISPDATADGGEPDAASPSTPFEPMPPVAPADVAPAALPILTPCPEGWTTAAASSDGVVEACEPWPAAPTTRCGPGEARFPGADGCAPVGRACPPASDFAEIDVPALALFVLASTSPGGDGSRASPFRTLGEALAVATAGTTVMIGRGEYDEAVVVPDAVTLQGACAAETTLRASTPSTRTGVLVIAGSAIEIRDLRVGASPRPGIVLDGAASAAVLRGVAVEGAQGEALVVVRGRLDAEGLVVRDTTTRPGDDATGRGARVSLGARVTLRRAVFERNRYIAVSAFDPGTTLTLDGVAITDTDRSDAGRGQGLAVSTGATAEVTRTILERNRGHGVFVGCNEPGCGATVLLEDVVVRETSADDDDSRGRALGAQEGSFVLRRVWLSRYHAYGLLAFGSSATVDAEDLVVTDGLSRAPVEIPGSGGIAVRDGASMTVRRVLVERGGDLGVLADDPLSRLVAEDLVVRDTGGAPSSEEYGGGGALVIAGAAMNVSRARVERAIGYGIAVAYDGTTATLRDLVVSDTQSTAEDEIGAFAISVEHGASFDVERARIERTAATALFVLGAQSELVASDIVVDGCGLDRGGSGGFGLAVRDGQADLTRARIARCRAAGIATSCSADSVAACTARVQLEDVEVRELLGTEDGFLGRGLAVHLGARLEATRVAIASTREYGISVGEGGVVEGTDVDVRDVQPSDCASTTCAGEPAGTGIAVAGGSRTSLSRFAVSGAALCGALIDGSETALDLSDGEVRSNTIGLCVQTDGYDVERLLMRVAMRDNGRNVDVTTTLPVPAPVVP